MERSISIQRIIIAFALLFSVSLAVAVANPQCAFASPDSTAAAAPVSSTATAGVVSSSQGAEAASVATSSSLSAIGTSATTGTTANASVNTSSNSTSTSTTNSSTATGSSSTSTSNSSATSISTATQTGASTTGSAASATGAAVYPTSGQAVADGTWVIETGLAESKVIDLAGQSKRDGGNVQIYEYNGTVAQQWKITYDATTGYYTISSVASGKVLDVAGARASNGTNVQQHTANGTPAQQWSIIANGDGSYKIESALKTGLVLDVAAGRMADGTNVQVYTWNGTPAQLFWFCKKDPYVAPGSTDIANGCYTVKLYKDTTKVLDVAGAGSVDGSNVQLYESNSTIAQEFYFTLNSDGTYTIANVGSGKVLDVAGGSVVSTANVWLYASNGTNAQKWVAVYDAAVKAYSFISKVNGLYLETACGRTNNGNNMDVYRGNGTAAQKFVLTTREFLDASMYSLYALTSWNKVIDDPGSSTTAGTQLQTYTYNASSAQKYLVARVDENIYTLQSLCSGEYLTEQNSKLVLGSSTGTAAQWKAVWANGALSLINVATGNAIAVEGGSSANEAKIITAVSDGSTAQHFRFANVSIIDDGYYNIVSEIGKKVLDVAGGNRRNNANVDIYTANGTNAQTFLIQAVGSVYKILNAATGRAVDVDSGSTAEGANVQMYSYNGTGAQLWSVKIADGGYLIFVNQKSGKTLDVASGVDKDGTNVDIYTANGTSAQNWRVAQTSYTPDRVVVLWVPAYNQYAAGLPTGCEACALTDLLRYWGFSLGNCTIADDYMPWSDWNFVTAFWGNPHDANSNSTMAPCITNTANSFLRAAGSALRASNLTGAGFYSLFDYIAAGSPVVVWSTIGMGSPGNAYGYQDGYTIYSGSHTVVLDGYNKNSGLVHVSDSIDGSIWRNASAFASTYYAMGSQAVVIQ